MPALNCPLCGSRVRVEKAETLRRYSCTKCHTPFHLDRAGDAVVGAPPDVEQDVEELKQKVREGLKKFPAGRVVGGLAFVLVAGLTLYYVFGPADRLKPAAERAARAFAGDDLNYLKSVAAAGTEDDLVRWYEESHAQFLDRRKRWNGKPEAIEVGIGTEDQAQGRGATAFSVHPGEGNARDVSLANPSELTAGAVGSFDSAMNWTLGRGGHWRIDGRATYAAAHPPTSTTSNVPAPALKK